MADNKKQKMARGKLASPKTGFALEAGLAFLVLLTLIAVLAERPILETTLELSSRDGWVAHYSDAVGGGTSTSEIVDRHAMSWRCHLSEQMDHPYCGFELILAPDRETGRDLRKYDQVRLWMDYEGPTETIRVYLRNFDPAYSSVYVNESTKYNQVEFDASEAVENAYVDFAMADFFVANWWFQQFRIPPEQAHPQFDNIVVIEVSTGVSPLPGEHNFTLERIELTGQVLTTEQWYQGILAAWVLVAMLFLLGRSVMLTRQLRLKSAREAELMEINSLLDSQSRHLEEKAKTDPLTGAFNRDGIEEAIRLGLMEFRRHGLPFSVVMLDVDHFKQVNDSHGHPVGDRILTGLTHLVKDNIRTSDLFARWGGEEFLLVCRDTSLEDASRLADKLRLLIEARDFGEPVGITASFGVASLNESESLDQFFERLDRALYAAKDQGRNRVVVAD